MNTTSQAKKRMTREDFARVIHFDKVLWVSGILNILVLINQAWHIYHVGTSAGISRLTFTGILFIQTCIGFEGYLKKSRQMVFSMALCDIVVAIILVLTFIYP